MMVGTVTLVLLCVAVLGATAQLPDPIDQDDNVIAPRNSGALAQEGAVAGAESAVMVPALTSEYLYKRALSDDEKTFLKDNQHEIVKGYFRGMLGISPDTPASSIDVETAKKLREHMTATERSLNTMISEDAKVRSLLKMRIICLVEHNVHMNNDMYDVAYENAKQLEEEENGE